ncbi:MAG: ArsR/SmtB family transcription factor, partial [Vulcanococcus sp.]
MNPVTTAQELCPLFKALADPRRLEVGLALAAGERCVCELTEQMGLAQSKL